ncbi:acyltransferase [Pseudokineococcus marinus]|uniref:Acyltransferase n=2 Tax=Pseudokineococcus marinus TaxID=351215 RepID=A0A849BPU8_9ACTN|nr:acyltransferase family protein [Pseudokineococcus marinus]NNH23495.1 acyltransferase [Pseudokineococcus marinus]
MTPRAVVEAWSRFLVRVLPPIALTVAGTLVAVRLLLPATQWLDATRGALASIGMVQNVRLGDQAVDYLARGDALSPFQHLWSTSLQGQVTLVLPVLALVVALGARATGARAGRCLVAVLLALTAASFVRSVQLTALDQPAAYFAGGARAWELGAGALAAVVLARWRPGTAGALVLGWAGVLGLLATGVLIPPTSFPGVAAALPVLSGLAVVAAAHHGGRGGAHRLLSAPVLARPAPLSFPLYLWHWPVLVAYLSLTGRQTASLLGGAAVVALSVALAVLTHLLLDGRLVPALRARSAVAAGLAALALVLPVVGGAAAWGAWMQHRVQEALAADARPGALALDPRTLVPEVEGPPLPDPTDLWASWPDLLERPGCSADDLPDEVRTCWGGVEGAARRVVVVGDSHSVQWVPPLLEVAVDLDLEVVWMTRGGCRLQDADQVEDPECRAWNERVLGAVGELDPDLLVTTVTSQVRVGGGEELAPRLLPPLREVAASVPVMGMRDSPRYDEAPTECLLTTDDPVSCGADPADLYSPEVLEEVRAQLPEGVRLVDTRDYFCSEDRCPAVAGGLFVYSDDNHATGLWMESTRHLLRRDLAEVVGW